uniref:Uncharacterized protein n=1 Tax=Tetranychus urticae TaxID=32264 RepID=T1KGK6_TETUR
MKLLEKLYDLGAEKALSENLSHYLEHLEVVNVPKTHRHEVINKKKLDQYITGIPWCLNQIESKKNLVIRLLADLPQTNVSMAKPSNELLESINLPDLVGDAYDLAFLSSQLESSKPITRPRIIQQISLKQMPGQKCNEALFHITLKGGFFSGRPWATYAARHVINKLTLAEVPYFKELHKASEVKRQQVTCYDFLEYYIINDQRKVLDKILQNKNPVEKLDSNSSTVQSTSDIDVLDKEMIKKLQYSFTISTGSGFKFTSEMISIIKMNLVQMECPVCIEFQDKVWVVVNSLKKGNKIKARFWLGSLKFKMLHEKDEDDFDVVIVMKLFPSVPTKISKMLANKLIKTTEAPAANVPLLTQAVPLGHFN